MLSKKALAISPSPTMAIDSLAKKMKSEGMDVIGFGVGEPDFDTPAHIKEAAVNAIRAGFTKYTPAEGTLELRNAICCKLLENNNLSYNPEQIVVSNGAKHSLSNVFAAILNPGDEVIIPAPFWVSYPEMVKLNEGIPVILPTSSKNNFKVTGEDLAGSLTTRTKAIVLNSPSNPTGQIYTREELETVAAFAVKNQIFIISDEVYETLIYGSGQHISIASLGEDIKHLTVVVNGVSKTYAMTGWRIGYTASCTEIAKIMGSVQSHATSNPNSIAQKAALAALQGSQECVAQMNKAFGERRDYMVSRFAAIPTLSFIEPQGAFYVFLNVSRLFGSTYKGSAINNSEDFSSSLLRDYQVALVPGGGFGAPDYVRLSYALGMEQIKKGLDRIEDFVNTITQ